MIVIDRPDLPTIRFGRQLPPVAAVRSGESGARLALPAPLSPLFWIAALVRPVEVPPP